MSYHNSLVNIHKFVVGILGCFTCCTVMANENDLIAALQDTYSACVGIDAKLADLKRMAGINTAITGVGTGLGIGATAVGIAKSQTDEKIDELLKQLAEKEAQYGAPVIQDPDQFAAEFQTMSANTAQQSELDQLTQKSKKLGNWRTGLMAASTATNIAGAVIASQNRADGDLQAHIDSCNSAVNQLSRVKVQAGLEGIDTSEADQIINACKGFSSVDLSKINQRATGAMTASAVGAVTGLTGTITSAMANSDSTRQLGEDGLRTDKEKNLNAASNVLAGTTTVASAAATIFNASQIKAIKDVATVAEKCTEVLK